MKESDEELEINFNHSLNYTMASHGILNNNFVASFTTSSPNTFNSQPLNLSLLALDPITHSGPSNNAVIGFLPDKFLVKPAPKTKFKIISEDNNLLITGSGFIKPMYTDFSNGPVTINVFFKIIDNSVDYDLFLKCYKATSLGPGCILTMVFNGNTDNTVVKHVDAAEAQAGENNLISINLRNKNYNSYNYHDYLQYGKNSITITITPSNDLVGSPSDCGFILRTLAIG